MTLNASFITSIMNVKADVYKQTNSQDQNTGAITRQWQFFNTIQCKVEPIKAGGASTRGDSKTFDKGPTGGYAEKLQLKIKTTQLLSKRWRIQNIRSSDNKQVFVEIDVNGQPDSIFEVYSSHAVLDPFGKVNYYEATLQRVPLQTDAITEN
jgi:hypothetical protein